MSIDLVVEKFFGGTEYNYAISFMLNKYPNLDHHTVESCVAQALMDVAKSHDFAKFPTITHSLIRYANFRCLDAYRKECKKTCLPLDIDPVAKTMATPSSYKAGLEEMTQTILIDRFMHEMEIEDIASYYDLTPQEVEHLIEEGVKTLHECYFGE